MHFSLGRLVLGLAFGAVLGATLGIVVLLTYPPSDPWIWEVGIASGAIFGLCYAVWVCYDLWKARISGNSVKTK